MIAATMASTSVETSRLEVSRASKAVSNPWALMSSQTGITFSCGARSARGAFGRLVVAETDLGLEPRPDIPQFAFEALHFEPNGGAAEKGERHDARGRVGFLKADRQQVERRRALLGIEADMRDFQHAIETQ